MDHEYIVITSFPPPRTISTRLRPSVSTSKNSMSSCITSRKKSQYSKFILYLYIFGVCEFCVCNAIQSFDRNLFNKLSNLLNYLLTVIMFLFVLLTIHVFACTFARFLMDLRGNLTFFVCDTIVKGENPATPRTQFSSTVDGGQHVRRSRWRALCPPTLSTHGMASWIQIQTLSNERRGLTNAHKSPLWDRPKATANSDC